jgi:hypothetical protein
LFLDPAAAGLAGLERPLEPSADLVRLFPVRAEFDSRVERLLEKRKILEADTVRAIRLIDDENDVFSRDRCALHPTATRAAMAHPSAVDEAIRAVMRAALPSLSSLAATPARRAYHALLLDPHADATAKSAAADAYGTELAARMDTKVAALDTATGLAALATRVRDRQAAARAMFARDARPLPTLPR